MDTTKSFLLILLNCELESNPYGIIDRMNEEQAKQLASQLLKVTPKELQSRLLDNDAGVYVYQPIRGGGALMIANDQSVLFANSSVNPDEHLVAFLDGKRTDPSKFSR